MKELSGSSRQIRVGVFYSTHAILGKSGTGTSTYEVNLSKLLNQLVREEVIEMVEFVPSKGVTKAELSDSSRFVYKVSALELLGSLNPLSLFSQILLNFRLRTARLLEKHEIDVAYFTSLTAGVLWTGRVPFVSTVWDLGHRQLPGFSEVWRAGIWTRREALLRIAVGRASAVLVDHQYTRESIQRLYGVETSRVWVNGILPTIPSLTEANREFDFPYLIYPAARWPHKNHVTLLRAFARVSSEIPDARLILTGADFGNKARLDVEIATLKLQHKIIDLGEIDRSRLLGLIQSASALVMPSLLGPNNLPPLEAIQLGVPTLVSNAHIADSNFQHYTKILPGLDVEAWAAAIREILSGNVGRPPATTLEDPSRKIHRQVFERLTRELSVIQTDSSLDWPSGEQN